MNRLLVRLIPAVSLLLMLGGCEEVTSQPWSTKSASLQFPLVVSPVLAVSPAVTADATPAGLREASIELLVQACDSTYPLLRANALEAMQAAPDEIEPLIRRGLVDENRAVRFIATMSIGQMQLKSLAHLTEPLLRDESLSVQAAAIFALHRCGHRANLNPLAEMIVSHDPEVRANAAMVLGELGDTSAAAMLRQAVRGGVHHASLARTKLEKLQFAEALVKLGQREEISVIRAALFSTPENGELAALACMLTGRLRDEQAIPDLSNLARATGRFQRSAEIRMAATWAMAQINPSFAPIEVPMAYVGSDQYQLRAQAASTLGELGDATVYRTLASLLGDPNPLVQVAAAGAILRVDRTLDKVVRNRPNY